MMKNISTITDAWKHHEQNVDAWQHHEQNIDAWQHHKQTHACRHEIFTLRYVFVRLE